MVDRPSATVGVVANTVWNIANFRLGLVAALGRAGHRVVCLAPNEDFWPGGGAIDALEDAGARYVEVPMDRGGMNPFADLVLFLRLLRSYRKARPQLLLHYTLKPIVYGSIAARWLRIPAVAVVTGQGSGLITEGSRKAALTRRLVAYALRRATCVYFLNAADRDEFVGGGVLESHRARVLPGEGVDTARFSPSGPRPDAPTFLMVARLLRDKGVYEYVEAARAVKDTHPGARFLLGGGLDSANPSAVSEAELGAWQDEAVIEYLGVVDDPRPWYAQASAVVLPSYREGMSRVLLEALASGVPVIASDVPGCRELAAAGSGLVCQPADPESLTATLERFLELDRSEQQAMGDRGRQRALAEFDQSLVNQIYLDALPALLAGSCPPGAQGQSG